MAAEADSAWNAFVTSLHLLASKKISEQRVCYLSLCSVKCLLCDEDATLCCSEFLEILCPIHSCYVLRIN